MPGACSLLAPCGFRPRAGLLPSKPSYKLFLLKVLADLRLVPHTPEAAQGCKRIAGMTAGHLEAKHSLYRGRESLRATLLLGFSEAPSLQAEPMGPALILTSPRAGLQGGGPHRGADSNTGGRKLTQAVCP